MSQYNKLILILVLLLMPLTVKAVTVVLWNDSINTATVGHDTTWTYASRDKAATTKVYQTSPLALNGSASASEFGSWIYRYANATSTRLYHSITYEWWMFRNSSVHGSELFELNGQWAAGNPYCGYNTCNFLGYGEATNNSPAFSCKNAANLLYYSNQTIGNNTWVKFQMKLESNYVEMWVNNSMIANCTGAYAVNYTNITYVHIAKEASGTNRIQVDNITAYYINPDIVINQSTYNMSSGSNLANQTGWRTSLTARMNTTDTTPTVLFNLSNGVSSCAIGTSNLNYTDLSTGNYNSANCSEINSKSHTCTIPNAISTGDASLFIACNVSGQDQNLSGILPINIITTETPYIDTTDLTAYFSFDVNYSDDLHHLSSTLSGATYSTTDKKLGTGAYIFRGDIFGDSINASNPSVSASNGTIALWVKPANNWSLDISGVYSTGIGAVGESRIFTHGTFPGNIRYDTGGSTRYNPYNYTWNNATWHYLAFVWRAQQTILYVDGINVSNLTSTYDIISNSFKIGTMGDEMYFNGTIDEVSIWDRSLNDSDISILWNNGAGFNPVVPSNLNCSPTINKDWSITSNLQCNNSNINIGTGNVILKAPLTLFDSNLTAHNISAKYSYFSAGQIALNISYSTTNKSTCRINLTGV